MMRGVGGVGMRRVAAEQDCIGAARAGSPCDSAGAKQETIPDL